MHYKESKECLGSRLTLELNDVNLDTKLIENFWFEIDRFEQKYSRFIVDSDLSKLNANFGKITQIDEEFYNFLQRSEELFVSSSGYFDVLVEKILSDLGYDKDFSFQKKPSSGDFIGRIEFFDGFKVKIPSSIDFGGFGKGYALDLAKKFFNSLTGACLNAGGDIWAKGIDDNESNWRFYLENPLNFEEVIGFVDVNNFCLASSNSKKRNWLNGHHLINPITKSPANEMLAVFIESEEGILADAFATALYVMGFEKAISYLSINPVVEAVLISPRGEVWKSMNFKGSLYFA